MIPSGRQLEVETHPMLQDDLWNPTPEYKEDYSLDPHEANWFATLGAGVLFLLIGLLLTQESYSIGILFILIGVVAIGGAISALKGEDLIEAYEDASVEWDDTQGTREWEEDLRIMEMERKEARQREIDEIVKAVKSTIMVRCRYCGTLNEEKANKCESCGANL